MELPINSLSPNVVTQMDHFEDVTLFSPRCSIYHAKAMTSLPLHDTITSLTPILVKLCIFIYLIWHDKLIYRGVFLLIIHDSVKVAHSPFSSPQMMCRISGFQLRLTVECRISNCVSWVLSQSGVEQDQSL